MRTIFVRSFLALSVLGATEVLAWGGKGHATVNRIAIDMVANPEAKKFLSANSVQVIRFANTPDVKWKSGPSASIEKPMHWFEMDGYNGNRFGEELPNMVFGRVRDELGQDFVGKYGLAMWRVSDFYVQLVAAFKKGDFKRAVQISGVMGHYVGDMTQPMHASTDYDGQSINKPGIHKYYETTLVDRINEQHLVDVVQRAAGERRSGFERSIVGVKGPAPVPGKVMPEDVAQGVAPDESLIGVAVRGRGGKSLQKRHQAVGQGVTDDMA